MSRIAGIQKLAAFLAVLVILSISVAGVVVSRAANSPGCDEVATPIEESKKFTPYEDRLTQGLETPINPLGVASIPVPDDVSVPSVDGVPRAWATGSEAGAIYQYFLEGSIDRDLRPSEFYAAGGIQLDLDPVNDAGESFAPYLLSALGKRAVPVQVGDYEAALTWADPQSSGLRPHHLYWSDAKYNYVLIANTSPEKIVAMARGLVCGETLG